MKRLRVLAGTLVTLAIPILATATPILWNVALSNPNYNQVVTGSFVYDADLNTFTTINVSASATDVLGVSNTTYTSLGLAPVFGPNTASNFTFANSAAADLTNVKIIKFSVPLPGLTNAGGLIAGQGFFTDPQAFLAECINATCTSQSSLALSAVDTPSSLTGTPLATTVPEPASLSLLAAGLAGVGARRWRQRRNQ